MNSKNYPVLKSTP
jgi:hypothetical protein